MAENSAPQGFATEQIHAGVTPDPLSGAILTPIYVSTTFVQESVDQYMSRGYSYSRAGNPTVRALEKKMAALEHGYDGMCFSTGMAATTAFFMGVCEAGDHVVCSQVAYGGTYRFLAKILSKFGVKTSFVDTSDVKNVEAAITDKTKVVFTETPANPTMDLSDLKAISAVTTKHKVIHAVDNTFATPYFQNPLDLGADVVIHSTTKYIDGHNMTVGGAVVCKTKELDEQVRFIQLATGTIMAPQVAFLQLQGVKTLSLRMEAQTASAMKIAQWLEKQPKVERVKYPGLASHPHHELAKTQQRGFGAMLWFDVKGGLEAGKRFMNNVKLWSLGENLGALESLVTHCVTMTHAAVPVEERLRVGITDGLIRLSVGGENVEDLIADLEQALSHV